MRKILTSLTCILFLVAPLFAEAANAPNHDKDGDRLKNCGTVLKQTLDVPGRKVPASNIVLSRHVAVPPPQGHVISTLDAEPPKHKR